LSPIDYRRLDYARYAHHVRYVRYIMAMIPKLICQECCGAGGWTEPVLDDGSGPFEQCGWCEGTGYVTRWLRGLWLRYQKQAA
jgi:hypothetical protein